MRNLFKGVVLALLLSAQAYSTSIVAKVTQQHIILAADTLHGTLTEQSGIEPTNIHDTCKIVVLGDMVFAASGYPDYQPVNNFDDVQKWDAYDDAKTNHNHHPKNIRATAEEWGKLAVNHYESFYHTRKDRVIEMADDKFGHLLVTGVFAGWNPEGKAELVFMNVTLEGTFVKHKPKFMHARTRPYSANELTRLMIESDVPKSKAVQKEWASKSGGYPTGERDWRELEFLIQTTSEHQPDVGKDVDVLELTPSGTKWLQKKACP